MKSMMITLMSPSGKAVQLLHQLLNERLKPVLHMAQLELAQYEEYTNYRVSTSGATWTKTQRKQIVEQLSEAIAAYMLEEEEESILARVIANEYGYDQEEELRKILECCRQVLEKNIPASELPERVKSKREQRIIKQLRAFLTEQDTINVSGFLRFRAADYRNELTEVVEYAIDEYLMDKQYQEFIGLLKYFVYIQETKIPAAHLMHKGGHEFVLLNEKMKPIDTSKLDSTFTVELLDKEINFEDLIVSTLITVAPQQIHVHTREPELQVIKTIMQIFEGRATLCDYCKTCKPVLGERKKQDQFYP